MGLSSPKLSRPSAANTALKKTIAGYCFISPWLIGFLLFTMLPILTSAYYAMTSYDILDDPVFIGFGNFASMMSDELFWKSIRVTFSYVFFSVPLRLAFALFVAVLLNQKARFQRFHQTLYYLPSILGGSIAVAVMWRRLFMSDGAFNAILEIFGLNREISWIGREDTALMTLVVLAVWQFGSSMLIFLAGLKQIPLSYYEAARIDGARRDQMFFKITIPYLSSVIFFNLIMQLIAGFTVFTQAFVVSGGSGDPLNATLVYALYLYQRAFKYYQMGYASAMAWVLVLIIGSFTVVLFKTQGKWVFYESKEGK